MSGITLILLRGVRENFTAQKAVPARPSGKGWLEKRYRKCSVLGSGILGVCNRAHTYSLSVEF